MEQQGVANVDIVEQLARREQQLEQLRLAYVELQQRQQQNHDVLDKTLKSINHLPVFTGQGDVTINSFFRSIEYLLSTIQDDGTKREAVRTIFYRIIQGPAKDAIINIPEPDNWTLIKETLKLRYRPDVEPHQLYRKVANLKVNSVSELMVEIQDIKYKADELTVYYTGDHYIDLSNMDSILINTVKEMTQGILLEKIYDVVNLNDILRIMISRRFEDSCIRPEYRKYKMKETRAWDSRYQDKGQRFNNTYAEGRNKNQNIFNRFNNSPQERQWNRNEIKYNNSGQYRQNNNFNNGRFNNYNQFAGYSNFQRPQTGNPGQSSGQYRQNPFRQSQVEPMEIGNIQMNRQINEVNYNEINQINHNNQIAQLGNPREIGSQYRLPQSRQKQDGCDQEETNYNQEAGHPNHRISQNRFNLDRQSPEGPEVNNTIFFTRQPQNAFQR